MCGRSTNPSQSHKLVSSAVVQDIGSMSRSELISLMQEKGAYGLRRALMDMGVIVDASRSYGSAGSVREAVALYGLKRRMLHIAELLADPVALKEVSLHHLSNLAVQVCGESSCVNMQVAVYRDTEVYCSRVRVTLLWLGAGSYDGVCTLQVTAGPGPFVYISWTDHKQQKLVPTCMSGLLNCVGRIPHPSRSPFACCTHNTPQHITCFLLAACARGSSQVTSGFPAQPPKCRPGGVQEETQRQGPIW